MTNWHLVCISAVVGSTDNSLDLPTPAGQLFEPKHLAGMSMPKLTLNSLRSALHRERRTSTHLRKVITAVEQSIAENRRELELQFTRIAQLQVEVDRLKRLSDERKAS